MITVGIAAATKIGTTIVITTSTSDNAPSRSRLRSEPRARADASNHGGPASPDQMRSPKGNFTIMRIYKTYVPAIAAGLLGLTMMGCQQAPPPTTVVNPPPNAAPAPT